MYYNQDTIYALATAYGKAGVAVIRISGLRSLDALAALSSENLQNLKPREVKLLTLIDKTKNSELDKALVVYFKNPHSFTGEDIVELHIHGSLAVINDTLSCLNRIDFLRPAEAGEFSKRAFYNNKLDLVQAEGLSLLIDSETAEQRRIALEHMKGSASGRYEEWRLQIINILAKLEAFIDFPDDDIPAEALAAATDEINDLKYKIKDHLKGASYGRSLMEGIKLAIIGPPNAGKSSLMNKFAKDDLVIVSDIAGTTRDVVKTKLDFMGYCLVLTDTAGIRGQSQTEDIIEIEGIRRSKAEMQAADIIFAVFDINNLTESEALLAELDYKKTIVVLNKTDKIQDLKAAQKIEEMVKSYAENAMVISMSLLEEQAIERLYSALHKLLDSYYALEPQDAIVTQRQEKYLLNTLNYLEEFNVDYPLEIATETIRNAATALGQLTGRIDIEEILDNLFANFCIGK